MLVCHSYWSNTKHYHSASPHSWAKAVNSPTLNTPDQTTSSWREWCYSAFKWDPQKSYCNSLTTANWFHHTSFWGSWRSSWDLSYSQCPASDFGRLSRRSKGIFCRRRISISSPVPYPGNQLCMGSSSRNCCSFAWSPGTSRVASDLLWRGCRWLIASNISQVFLPTFSSKPHHRWALSSVAQCSSTRSFLHCNAARSIQSSPSPFGDWLSPLALRSSSGSTRGCSGAWPGASRL